MKGYETDARDHLQRAVKLLLKGGFDNLLYAGLEIRLGTEARQNQYANSWEHIPKKFQRSYKTTEVGKALERAFKLGLQVALLRFRFDDGNPPLELRYTPVSRELRDACCELGNYLHAVKWQDMNAENEGGWAARLRFLVITGVIHLHVATEGQLLGPALWNTVAGKRQFSVRAMLPADDPAYSQLTKVGRNVNIEVDYLPIQFFVAPLLKAFEDIEVLRKLDHQTQNQEIRAEAVPIQEDDRYT